MRSRSSRSFTSSTQFDWGISDQWRIFSAGCIAAVVVLFFVVRYWIGHRKREAAAIAAAEHGKLFSDGPKAQHPHINLESCIGCGTCVDACPEGDVLGILNGKATIVKGHKCIGHGICADVCPVGAITMVMAKAIARAPTCRRSRREYETSVPNLFIAGELGGLALIKNAVNQGRECVDLITSRLQEMRTANPSVNGHSDVLDVIIVGAGPAGISASLRATENGISHLTLERGVGGWNGIEVSAPKAGDDQPGRVPALRKVQQDPVEQGRIAGAVGKGDWRAPTSTSRPASVWNGFSARTTAYST